MSEAVFGEGVCVARVADLVAHLPADSALARAELGAAAGWGTAEELLAGTVNLLQVLNRTVVATTPGVKKHQVPKVQEVKRPDPPRRPGTKPRMSSMAEIRAFMAHTGGS